MGYSWFPVVIGTDKEGKPIKHPAYQGTERLSIDGTLWMCHDELLGERGLVKAKTATMPDIAIIKTKVGAGTLSIMEAVCSKDDVQTKALLDTVEWKPVEVKVEEIKEEVPKEVVSK